MVRREGVFMARNFLGSKPRQTGRGMLRILEEGLAYLVLCRAQCCMRSSAIGGVGC